MGGRGGKQDRLAKTSYSRKWPEAVSLGPLLGLWSTDTLCLLDQVGFRASRIDRVYHPHSPGPFSSLLLLPVLLGHGPKHWGSDPPAPPSLEYGCGRGFCWVSPPSGPGAETWHPRDRAVSTHFLVTVCPRGFSCSPGWVLGPSEPEAGFNPPFSRSSSCLPRGQSFSSPHLCPHLRKTRSRYICTLGPGLPLSAPAASQHLGRGCGPDWTPGPAHSVYWLPTLGQGLENPSLKNNHLQEPHLGPDLVLKFLSTPVREGPPSGSPQTPSSRAPPVIAGVRAPQPWAGPHPSPCPHPYLYSPGAP